MSSDDTISGGIKKNRWTMDMLARRSRILSLTKQGLRYMAIINMMMEATDDEGNRLYPASESTLKRDIRDMDKWLPELVRFDPEEYREVTAELLADLKENKRLLYNKAVRSNSDSASVGASKEINNMTFKELEFRQTMGQIPKVAEKVRVEGGAVPLVIGLYDADAPEWDDVKKDLRNAVDNH